jgi:hypothetical protein
MEQLFAPPDHPVFQLVPPAFEEVAQAAYMQMGQPPVSDKTFWGVYMQLLNSLRNLLTHVDLAPILASHQEVTRDIETESIPLLLGLKELPNANDGNHDTGDEEDSNPPGPSFIKQYCSFTDEENSSDGDR